MQAKLSKAFDESLARIKRGEAVKACLADYPHLRPQLVPLLHAALSIGTVSKVLPSDDFRKLSKAHLMAGLHQRSMQAAKSQQAKSAFNGLGAAWRIFEHAITGPAKLAIPVTLVLILALQCLFLSGSLNFISSSATHALASHCTLSDLTGGAELQMPGSGTWEEAENGMTLKAGSRVRTAPNSSALLTFFNGSTVKLEPGTDVVVEQVEVGSQNQPTVIVLKQWLGKTWSRVTQLADPGSRYEIQTPSACILVRGTLFVTEVDETGATRVQTIEGVVSVSAQGEEVYLPAGQQTAVEPGASPSEPMPVSPEENAGSQGQVQEGPPLQGNHPDKPLGQGQEQPSEKAAVTEALAEGAEPFEATGKDPESEVLRRQDKEGLPAEGTDNEESPVPSQEELAAQGQATGEGRETGLGQRDMWVVVIGGVVALFWGSAMLIAERRHLARIMRRRRPRG